MKSTVRLVRISDDNIPAAMGTLLKKLSLPVDIKRIGIKINLCDYRKRETGVTTDPYVLEPLLQGLRERYPSADLYLFENDATGTLVDNLYRWLKLDKVAEKYDVRFVNLNKEKWLRIKIEGLHFKEIDIPELLMNSFIINHPKLKTHGRTKIAVGLKNIYGCYRIKEKTKYHGFLNDAIVDINIPIKSRIVIVDGYLGVEGNRGPTQGFPKKTNVLIGGEDIVAVDTFCARFMGFAPCFVRHITKAARKKLGSMKYNVDSEIPFNMIKEYKFEFNTPKYILMQTIRKILR